MIAFSPLPSIVPSGSRAAIHSRMSLAASSALPSLAAVATTSSSAAAAASSVAAVMPPSSAWLSSVSNNKQWVGSAWIISSAILTTYSTTRFLKYQGSPDTMEQSASGEGSRISRQFSSILNSSKDRDHRDLEAPQKRTSRTKMSRASLLTLYRFSGSLVLGLFLHAQFYNLSRLCPRFLQTVRLAQKFLLPALFLFVANYSNSIALDRIGISLTYTSKCGIPLITVLFTLLLDGVSALPSKLALLSLLPIAAGVAAASWNSPEFEAFGFLAALSSTTSQAALNVVSKRAMRKTGAKGPDAQRAMVFVALGISLIMATANRIGGSLQEMRDYGSNIRNVATGEGRHLEQEAQPEPVGVPSVSSTHPPLWLTCLAVLAYHMEYVLSFLFVGLVDPITYGTCDALRRLLIIITGRQFFGGNKFSATNLGGICMALLGALMYSITSAASEQSKNG